MKPFLKHTGAKIQDLVSFQDLIPLDIEDYYEPFLGGGSVMLNVKAERYITNDLDKRVYLFWNELFTRKKDFVEELISAWRSRFVSHDKESKIYQTALSKFNKTKEKGTDKYSIKEQERNMNMEIFYYTMREEFRKEVPSPIAVFFVKEFCYQGMDRYNSKGVFNVPYGGFSYSSKLLGSKLDDMREFAKQADKNPYFIMNQDFEEFLDKGYGDKDFVFLDPPYTTTFSNYGGNEFSHHDHERLKGVLENLDTRFLLVINKDDFTYNLYKDFIIKEYDKSYKVSFNERVSRKPTPHMIVRNYEI